MPRAEGKDDDGDGGKEDDGDGIPQGAVDFMAYGLSDDFESIRQAFIADNCAGFEDADELLRSGAGYPLEWSRVYDDYVDIYEKALAEFCEKRGMDERALLEDLEAVVGRQGADVLPTFLQSTEMDFFVANMHDAAVLERERRRAAERGAGDDPDDLTGAYTWIPPDKKDHEHFLKIGCTPWTMRQVVLMARRKQPVVVTHDASKHIKFGFKIPLIGSTSLEADLDGVRRPFHHNRFARRPGDFGGGIVFRRLREALRQEERRGAPEHDGRPAQGPRDAQARGRALGEEAAGLLQALRVPQAARRRPRVHPDLQRPRRRRPRAPRHRLRAHGEGQVAYHLPS